MNKLVAAPTILVVLRDLRPWRIPVEKISGVWALHRAVVPVQSNDGRIVDVHAHDLFWNTTHVPTGRFLGNTCDREEAEERWWILQRDFKWWWHDARFSDGDTEDGCPKPIPRVLRELHAAQ